jgi:hypothetical protein
LPVLESAPDARELHAARAWLGDIAGDLAGLADQSRR